MAFDKAKVVRAAERSLAQGKIAAAIKEYRLIVENDPDDFTALNMLGDLSARNGKKQEAISCFLKIANHYREQGFALKAIAMFKKIDKLQPNDPATANTLGALYEMQGLVVDARAQFLNSRNDIVGPRCQLIGLRIKIRCVAGSQIIKAQRRHAKRSDSVFKCSQGTVRTNRLIAERLADHQANLARWARGTNLHPAKKLVGPGSKIYRISQAARGHTALARALLLGDR